MKIILIAVIAYFLTSCTNVPRFPDETPKTPETPILTPTPIPTLIAPVPVISVPVLSWESGHPERKEWSSFIYKLLQGELFDQYNAAQDNNRLCSNFDKLTKAQKAHVWSEMWVWIAYYESGWKPGTKYFEKTMGYYSEGLLQLSYVDKQWAPYCKFPSKQDAAESILDPYINLHCGLNIMAKQIAKKGKLIVSSGVYWAVIKEGGKYQKIDAITAKTKALPFCVK